jgi:hypothetical protein
MNSTAKLTAHEFFDFSCRVADLFALPGTTAPAP